MFKRYVAAVLWFLLGVNGWAFLAALTGLSPAFGLVPGFLLAGAILAAIRARAASPAQLQLSK